MAYRNIKVLTPLNHNGNIYLPGDYLPHEFTKEDIDALLAAEQVELETDSNMKVSEQENGTVPNEVLDNYLASQVEVKKPMSMEVKE